jgi:hypothetical protein
MTYRTVPATQSCGFAGLPAAFWAALLVLVANDHVLKGSGLLPAVVTGKLSDFAGLIIAPVLLCAACSASSDRLRALLFGAVVLGFAAIKLSPVLADDAAAALTAIGVPSRIWCDPTDLIAFVVLPWAARLAQRVEPMPWRGSRRLAIGVAALACVATSSEGPFETEVRGPFVINWTHGEVDVSISKRWTVCGDPENAPTDPIEETLVLSPGYMKPLGSDADPSDSGAARCGLADIRVGDATTRVGWGPSVSDPMLREVRSGYGLNHADEWAFERGITVIGSAQAPAFEIGALLDEAEAL